jgi:hypothetical protein
MKALIQTGSSLSACGHAQAGGRVPVPPEKRFLINWHNACKNYGYFSKDSQKFPLHNQPQARAKSFVRIRCTTKIDL